MYRSVARSPQTAFLTAESLLKKQTEMDKRTVFHNRSTVRFLADFDENGYVDEADIDALLMYYLSGW